MAKECAEREPAGSGGPLPPLPPPAPGSDAAGAALTDGLPPELLGKVLERLPGKAWAWGLREVCRAFCAWADARQHPPPRIRRAGDPELPAWLLVREWRSLGEAQQARLLKARAGTGDLAGVAALRAAGCPWDEQACSAAAGKGHLEMLQWLRAQQPPCPWDRDRCMLCAAAGQLQAKFDALLSQRKQQPPHFGNELAPDTTSPFHASQIEQACMEAVCSGQVAVLKWLRSLPPSL